MSGLFRSDGGDAGIERGVGKILSSFFLIHPRPLRLIEAAWYTINTKSYDALPRAMTHVSKKYLAKDLRLKAWNRFRNTMKESKSGEELVNTLQAFFTSSEMTMLEKRLAIPILLEQKLSYREIGRRIDVSQETISFMKHGLTKKPRIHRKYSNNKKQQKSHSRIFSVTRSCSYNPRFD